MSRKNSLLLFDKDSATEPLNISFFGGEIVESIDNFLKERELSERDEWVLKQAVEYIEFAIHGRELTKGFKLSADVIEAVSAYGDLMEASSVLVQNKTIPKKDLDEMFAEYSNTLAEILDKEKRKTIDKQSVEKIRALFNALEDITLKRSLGKVKDVVNLELES